MDKQSLKNILKSQSANLSADALKKMNMLESGEIFTDPERYVQEILDSFSAPQVSGTIAATEDSLEAAFGTAQNTQAQRTETSFQDAFGMSQTQYTQQPHSVQTQSFPQPQPAQPKTDFSAGAEAINRVEDRKRALAAKIAALRGITLPGDYLNNKGF